ncbi:hypothetical protein CAPTEDRAFT_228871 [Capitella teleta]|uniref:COMM domain-containing protein n=1 Tax=Capitella teleta TaxID=283909 RepID=R7TMZ6_CAPTE|nr:hypothetical protein CAPTEDRAFT_228871 [Capitella teleta]|eukprot:ELT95014.1 hypothetical protein CAPTEDRAFT_228871 [Capitella teleta]
MEVLQKTDVNNVAKVLHGVVDGICHRASIQYKDFSDAWDLEEWWCLIDGIKTFAQKSISEQWNHEQLVQNLPNLPEDYKNEVINAINVRRDDLRAALVETTCAVSHDSLNDFDWQVKLAMASDSIASLHQPLATVDFNLPDNGSDKTVSVELSQEEMKKMIASLEACNRIVNQMKT